MITRRFLLFVGRLVLFIDNDEAEIFQRRENSAARANHDPGAAGMNFVPFIVSLAFGEVAVQNGHIVLRLGKPAFEALDRLRRERNFGNKHDGAAAALQCGANSLQIDLSLATAGHAVQQNRARLFWRFESISDFFQRENLFRVQFEIAGSDKLFVAVWIARHVSFAQFDQTALGERAQRLVIE